ncbi:MAG TPA: hypothetical protein VGS11_07480 [Candidatus Bathyarchaeia archaeon]|nr:hypothetical protein [Candidatus Bathyarchaeia archaeon]
MASCWPVSSGDFEPPEQVLLSDSIRQKALELFDYEEQTLGKEHDFEELFVRILWEKDWTDKLASILGRIRNRLHLRNTNTILPLELRALVPDMNEVAVAYEEMTSGYKEFIRTVLQAKHSWQEDG